MCVIHARKNASIIHTSKLWSLLYQGSNHYWSSGTRQHLMVIVVLQASSSHGKCKIMQSTCGNVKWIMSDVSSTIKSQCRFWWQRVLPENQLSVDAGKKLNKQLKLHKSWPIYDEISGWLRPFVRVYIHLRRSELGSATIYKPLYFNVQLWAGSFAQPVGLPQVANGW